MKKVLVALAMAVTLVGCSANPHLDDGYQPGDGVRTAVGVVRRLSEARRVYCDSTDPANREKALGVIQRLLPDYPRNGICTDLERLLAVNPE